jgi:DNA primase
MALYTRDSIERLREAVDMVDLVSTKTDLRRVGSRWQGLCPFHDERSPSFNVNAEEKLYICFGCEAKGDSIRFVEETEGLDFREAVETLAERYSVELQLEDEDPRAEERRRRRERLLALLERTSGFYAAFLWGAPEAAKARDYLAGRGLSEEILREFRVGYAPSAWDRVTVAAQEEGYKPEELAAAGVAAHGRNGGLYDRFRGRIMFPLANARGRVLGFGARAMGEGRGPKYLNTSENELYHKGRQLFGIDLARAHAAKSGRIVVVEGYTDVLALHQVGVRETVAIMGTALTQEQLAELGRAASLVVLALDADRSGQEAMLRAVRAAREKQLELQVVELPEGADPADLIASEGAEAFEARLGTAIEVERFQLRRLVADADLDSPSGTDRAIEEARALIATTPDRSVLRDSLVREGADRFGVPEEYLRPGPGDRPRSEPRPAAQPAAGAIAGDPGPERSRPAAVQANGSAEQSPAAVSLRPERAFIALCLASGEIGREYLARLGEGHLSSSLAARAVAHLAASFDDPLADLAEDDPALGGLVAGVIAEADERGPATEAELQISFLALELRRVERERSRAAEQGDHARQRELTEARAAALRELESVSSQTA